MVFVPDGQVKYFLKKFDEYATKLTNKGARKTRRPKNRTDGGVTRRRQPSRAQQKLCRDPNAAPISPHPPRGLRG
jgi:hypothetical protein